MVSRRVCQCAPCAQYRSHGWIKCCCQWSALLKPENGGMARDERALSALGNEASLHCALLDASGVPFAAAVD